MPYNNIKNYYLSSIYKLHIDLLFLSIISFTAIPYIFHAFLPPSIGTAIRAVIGSVYLYSLFILVSFKQARISGKWILYLLLIVNLIIVIRGDWDLSVKDMIQMNIFTGSGVMYYTLPLLVFIPTTKVFFNKFIYYLIVWMFLGILGYVLNIQRMFIERDAIETTFSYSGLIASLFLLLFSQYLNRKTKIFIYISYFIFFLTSVIMARRNLVLTGLEYFTMFVISQLIIRKKKIYFIIVIISLIPIIYLFFGQDNFTKKINERGLEDSRSVVDEFFLNDFLNDQSSLIWGRGMSGKYAQTYEENNKTYYERPGIETGYLNMILKGGLVQTILIITILIFAIIKGARSKSALILFSFFLFPLFIDNYTSSSISQWSAKSIIMWISISFCLNAYFKIDSKKILNSKKRLKNESII